MFDDPTLRHYARRGRELITSGNVEIVDRQFDFVRCILPYNYAYTSNFQQWIEAEKICRALEGPMMAQGIVRVFVPFAPPEAALSLSTQENEG